MPVVKQSTPDVVFIHSGFRTGSSWFRSKFRTNAQRLTFGEVFHEALATLNGQTAASLSSDSWNSRHPVTAPYFAEFMPLLSPDGGIEGFSEDMAFNSYFPRGSRLSDQERNYIKLLLDHSAERGKAPVLSCTRTLGRVRQIKNDFGGVHILLTRDPFRQWCSYTEQAALGNPYFLYTNSRILRSAKEAGWFRFGGDQDDDPNFLALDEFYKHALIHLKLYSEVASEADVIIDYGLLESEIYRQEVAQQIRSKCGTDVDLSDFKASGQFNLVDLPSVDVVDETLQAFLPSPEGMHPHVLTLYEAMKSSLTSYSDEAGELVRFSRRKLAELQATHVELETVVSGSSQVRGELERSIAEGHELRVRLESEHAELENAHCRLAALGEELNTTSSEREAIRTGLAQAQAELEVSRISGAAASEERDCTRRALEAALVAGDAATAERDLARENETVAQARLTDTEKEYRAALDALWRERQMAENELRHAALELEQRLRDELREAQTAAGEASREAARMEERSNQQQELLRRSDMAAMEAKEILEQHRSAIAKAEILIRSVLLERPARWQHLGQALGFARPSPAIQSLSEWFAPVKDVIAGPDHLPQDNIENSGTSMLSPPATEQRNPYLRANSLAELLSWHDVDFVRCAYVTILGRQPDPEGEAYYADRIRLGYSKMEILWRLRRSPEGPGHDPGIAGLDRALKREALRRNRLFGGLVRAVVPGEGVSKEDQRFRQLQNRLAVIAEHQSRQIDAIISIQTQGRELAESLEKIAGDLARLADRGVAGPLTRGPDDLDLSSRERDVFLTIRSTKY